MHDDTTPTELNPADTISSQLESFRQDPNEQDLFRELKRTLKKDGRNSDLAELLELRAGVETSKKEALRLWLDAANLRLTLGDEHRALDNLRGALEVDPSHDKAASKYFQALVMVERYAEAADVAEAEIEALEKNVDESKSPSALTRRLASRYRAVATLWQDHLGRLDRALQCWQRSFQLEPTKTEALEKSREIYASLGDEQMVATLYEAELKLIGKVGDRGRRAQIELALGGLKRKRADTESAAQHLESALELDPDSLDAKESLAEVLAALEGEDQHKRAGELFVDLGQRRMRTEDPEGAISFMRRALGVDPSSREGTDQLENMLSTARRWVDLERLFQHQLSLATTPEERAPILAKQAKVCEEHLDDREALKTCLRELSAFHGPASSYSVKLRSLFEEDEEGEELVKLLEAEIATKSAEDPQIVTLLLELATIYRQDLKDRDRAAEVLHRILAYAPLNPETLSRYSDHFRERRDWRGLTDLDEYVVEKMRELQAPVSELIPRLEAIAELCEMRLGDIDRAIATWRRIQELEGHGTKSSDALQRLMSRAKMWESLVGVLEQEAQQAATSEGRAEALRRIAQVYRERKVNPRRTIALYEEILTMFPEDDAALKGLAELYDREGDDAGLALTIRRQLDLESDRMDGGSSARSGSSSGLNPRPGTAREWPVAKRVERLTALRRIATMYEKQLANVEGVIFACSGILELIPGDREALERMERVLEKSGDTERLEQTLEYHVACSTAPVERSKLLRRLARLAAERSDEVSAMERWEQVLKAAPNDSEALAELAELYERHRRHADLAEVLDRALMNAELPAPGSPAAAEMSAKLKQLAHVLDAELEDAARATRAWQRVLELSERDRDALNALCRLYDHAQQWRELAEILDRQVPLYVEDDRERAAGFALKRAELLEERMGSPELAAEALERLIAEVSPRQIDAHRRLRRIYETRGDFESAVRIAEREIVLISDPNAKINRGIEIGILCRDRLSDPKRALQAFERVLLLAPDHEEALAAAADLYAQVGRWGKYVKMLEQRIPLIEGVMDKRAVLLRIANVTAEELTDHRAAFSWYTKAHELAADSTTLGELRRAAENYGLWRELANVYEGDREQLREGETISDTAAFVSLSREIATIAETRLRDPQRALDALYAALEVQPNEDKLLAEAERVASECDKPAAWERLLECFELQLASATGEKRIQLYLRRAQLREQHLKDKDGALEDLLRAFSWAPQRGDVRSALYDFGEGKKYWNEILSTETALAERAATVDEKIRILRRKATAYEEKANDSVRAFRTQLSAFILFPESEETIGDLWRLARSIGLYTTEQRTPEREPAAAHIEAGSDFRSDQPASVKPRREATQELNIADLLGGEDSNFGGAPDVSVDATLVNLPAVDPTVVSMPAISDATVVTMAVNTAVDIRPAPSELTQEIDISDLVVTNPAAGQIDPTMEIRTEDLIEALGMKKKAPSAAPPKAAKRTRGQGPPPPPPPRPTIKPMPGVAPMRGAAKGGGKVTLQRSKVPAGPTPRQALPTSPKRAYSSPWSELATVYCKLPAATDTASLRWRYRAAEVWETGAQEISRAFDMLASALRAAPAVAETRDRLFRLAGSHNEWDRLAELYDQAAEAASSADGAADLLLQVAIIRSKQGRPQETESLYRRVLGMRPDDLEARASLEQVYRDQERWVDLAAQLEERTDPRLGSAAPIAQRPALLRELAEIYSLRLSRPHDAIDTLERLLDIEPEHAELLSEIATLFEGIGRWSKVIQTLTRLCDLADGQPIARDSLRRIGAIYESHLELPDRAIVAYSGLLSEWPEDDEAFHALDRLYEQNARWTDLDAILQQRASLVRDPAERSQLLRRRAKIMLTWLDSPEDAATALRHARTIDPENQDLADDLVLALTRSGRSREAASVLEGCLERMRNANGAEGDIAALLISLGTLRGEKLGDPIGARTVLEEALELVPSHPTALAALARLTSADVDPLAHAEARLREAEAHVDSDAKVEALLDAGHSFRVAGNFEGANASFQQILSLRPYHAEATWALSALVEQGGDVDEAIRLLSARLQAASLESNERAEVLTQLAALSRQAGVESEAETRLKEALEHVPDHLPALFGLADLLANAERWQSLEELLSGAVPLLESKEPAPHAEALRRLALAYEGQGRGDDAYQTLISADRLHRGSLLIKLALGENRYTARRWREAALHLSALADHDDAKSHPSEVAAGLYHAALAEIRALRPDKAEALYKAALALKNNFAPALQALAEIAMERGNVEQASELMTKQAVATENPDERLSLFESLGDMIMQRLQDGTRAKVCYEAALNAAEPLASKHTELMHKLLTRQEATQDRAGAGRTCELLASFASDPEARCERHTEAAQHFIDSGLLAEARSAADRAVKANPYDLVACEMSSELAMKDGDFEATAATLGRLLNNREAPTSDEEANTISLLWNRLADARTARGDSKGAYACYEKAFSESPKSKGAMAARRSLLTIWEGVEGKEASLLEFRRELAACDLATEDVVEYAHALMAADDADGGRSTLELAGALGHEQSKKDVSFLARHTVRVMADDEAYNAGISNDIRATLLSDAHDKPMSIICGHLWEHAALLWSDVDEAFERSNVTEAKRVSAKGKVRAAAVFTRVARALNAPATVLYTTTAEGAPDVQVVCVSPPIVVFGSRLLKSDDISDLEMRFLLGRAAELAHPSRIIAAGQPAREFQELMGTIWRAFGVSQSDSAEIGDEQHKRDEKIRKTLPVRARADLEKLLTGVSALSPEQFSEACVRAADRAGLLICGDLDTAIRHSAEDNKHLLEMPLQPGYLETRAKLGIGAKK
jgi:tetratricopeptide (TPR) repeat protein